MTLRQRPSVALLTSASIRSPPQLLELHALYVDVDRAACEFVKANKKTLFSWIKYPGRRHTPFRICSPSQLCDAGCWIGVGVQVRPRKSGEPLSR